MVRFLSMALKRWTNSFSTILETKVSGGRHHKVHIAMHWLALSTRRFLLRTIRQQCLVSYPRNPRHVRIVFPRLIPCTRACAILHRDTAPRMMLALTTVCFSKCHLPCSPMARAKCADLRGTPVPMDIVQCHRHATQIVAATPPHKVSNAGRGVELNQSQCHRSAQGLTTDWHTAQ